jgi:hypothetical protein
MDTTFRNQISLSNFIVRKTFLPDAVVNWTSISLCIIQQNFRINFLNTEFFPKSVDFLEDSYVLTACSSDKFCGLSPVSHRLKTGSIPSLSMWEV